jgi:hypothetical protein
MTRRGKKTDIQSDREVALDDLRKHWSQGVQETDLSMEVGLMNSLASNIVFMQLIVFAFPDG